jgi:hypothetical protein
VHRDALQWAGRVEDAAALLEAQGRAVALRDRARSRRVERAAVALALLDELQSVWVGGGRGARAFLPATRTGPKGLGRCGAGGVSLPASQTLSVLSYEPDTMVLPSGEKATEVT